MNNDNWFKTAVNLATTTDLSWRKIALAVGISKSTVSDALRKYSKELYKEVEPINYTIPKTARILLFDLETAPTTAYVWGEVRSNCSTETSSQRRLYLDLLCEMAW